MSLRNSKIQSILFPKEKFTQQQCEEWLLDHHYTVKFGNKKGADETEHFYRYRQKNPSKKDDIHFATIQFGSDGIEAVIEYKQSNFVAKGQVKKKKKEPESIATSEPPKQE